MDEMEDAIKGFLLWAFVPLLAAKKAVDDIDEMLTGESDVRR